MGTEIQDRLDRIEHELAVLQRDVHQIRLTLGREAPAPPAPPAPARAVAERPPVPVQPAPTPQRREPPAVAPRAARPQAVLPKVDLADLVGARGLALAGGVVTLLGVVFFFVLAANNGWIGPVARVLLGGGASALVFAAGIAIHARYGRFEAAVAAAGAGIAGGYTTLLAAAALYDLVSAPLALVLAAGIALAGVALSLRWDSEVVAALGLLGAMAVPAVVLVDGRLTVLGTSFVGLVFAGAAVVSLRRSWTGLLVAAAAISVPQILLLVAAEDDPVRGRVLVLALAFVALSLAAGAGRQLRASTPQLDPLGGTLAAGAALVGLFSAFNLYDGDARGLVLSGLGVAYLALAAGSWRRVQLYELGVLAAAFGTAFAATATAQFLDGPSLVVAWAAEGVTVAWLGRRIAETRFQLISFAYLALALLYTLSEEAPPDTLYTAGADFLAGVPALAAVGVGLVGFGFLAASWPPTRSGAALPHWLAALVSTLELHRSHVRVATLALGAVVFADAASLALLDAGERLSLEPAFDWGHVAVTALWCLLGLGALATGARLGSRKLELGGVAGLGATLVSFELFTAPELGDPQIGWSAVALALAYPAGALLGLRRIWITLAGTGLGAIFAGIAAWKLLEGDPRGYVLVLVAAAYLAVSAALFARRDPASCFWTAGLALGLTASLILLDGTWLVLAWSVAAAALALAGKAVVEPRLWLGSLAFATIGGAYALGALAEPEQLVRAGAAPADGVDAIVLVVGALVALAFSLRPFEPCDAVDRAVAADLERLGRGLRWAIGGLGLYAASLVILGLAQWLSNASVTTAFQRGHTGVSACWGIVALTALVVGLRRGRQALRVAAVGLFALALGKLFLYDLGTLSSVTRAGSFLAVGGVLLLAGFLYQRLAAD